MYTEATVAEAMPAVNRRNLEEPQRSKNNFPGVDLISPTGIYGVQATAHLNKAKFDKTLTVITKELAKPRNRLKALTKVEVTG